MILLVLPVCLATSEALVGFIFYFLSKTVSDGFREFYEFSHFLHTTKTESKMSVFIQPPRQASLRRGTLIIYHFVSFCILYNSSSNSKRCVS